MALALRLWRHARSLGSKHQTPCTALSFLSPASEAERAESFSSVTTAILSSPQETGLSAKHQRTQPQRAVAIARVDLQSVRGFAADSGDKAKATDDRESAGLSPAEEEGGKPDVEDGSPPDERFLVLESALEHVAKLGWSEAALVQGAKSRGLSPTFVSAFPRGAAELVEHFMDRCNDELVERAGERREDLQRFLLRERLAAIVRMRLDMQLPYISSWPRALSLQAQPQNALKALEQRAHLADDIWRAAGDASSEVTWYAKRAALSLVYSAAEVYMLTDFSPEFRDTWAFLDRQIGTALDLGKSAQELGQLGGTLAAAFPSLMDNFKGPGMCSTTFGQKG